MNSSALSKLKSQIDVEFENLRRTLARHGQLIVKCQQEAPNELEIDGLANTLHSFYTGVENILKRISLAIEGEGPAGASFHKELLYRMARSAPSRPRVISDNLRDTLEQYLNFRHRFRHAYGFELRWSKMAHLIGALEETFHQLKVELADFLRLFEAKGQ